MLATFNRNRAALADKRRAQENRQGSPGETKRELSLPRPCLSCRLPKLLLDPHGIAELQSYIAELKDEIARAEAEITRTQTHRSSADAIFRRP